MRVERPEPLARCRRTRLRPTLLDRLDLEQALPITHPVIISYEWSRDAGEGRRLPAQTIVDWSWCGMFQPSASLDG